MTTFLILSCSSSDEKSADLQVLKPTPTCYQESDRAVVATFTNVSGIVIATGEDCAGYRLTVGPEAPKIPQRTLDLGLCNFPENFKKDSLKVIYSGYLFDTSDLNICAEFFEITDIRLAEPRKVNE